MSGWNRRTAEEARSASYQADLYSPLEKNVAIRQGGELTQIVAWDFDLWDLSPAILFLNANPWARENALITVGRKGFTLWFKILGLYPKHKVDDVWENGPKPEKDAPKEAKEAWEHIEWRANGYSVVHGLHPEAREEYRLYTVGNGMPEVPWARFYCPDATFKNWPRLFKDENKYKRGRPLSKELLEARLKIVEGLFKIIEIKDDGLRVNVECPNWEAHSSDTGDGQTIVFTGLDGTMPNFHCSHSHCKEEVNPEQSKRLRNAFIEAESIEIKNDITDQDERIKLCKALSASSNFYRRGNTYPYELIHWQSGMEEPITLNLSNFQNACDTEGIKFSIERKKGKAFTTPSDRQIKKYLAQPETSLNPIVKSYSRRPLLVRKEGGGAAILVQTFARELSVIVLGSQEQEKELLLPFEKGKELLFSYLDHWKFKTPADRARGIAQLLTPALLQGGFLARPVPVFLISSDAPAAGKTIWHNFAIKIYQEKQVVKAYGNSGVGGTDDMIRAAIKHGDTFCFVDEIKNAVASPLLNAIVTGQNEADIRSAHEKAIRASIDHLIVLLAGVRKDFSFEAQLSTRVIPIQILLSSYKKAPDGSLLEEWVEKQQLKLLAAIYAVIIKWVEMGSPVVASNTRFPSWSSVINGILEKVLGVCHCTEGLTKIQEEVANADVNWLVQIVEVLKEEGLFYSGGASREAVALSLSQLREFLLSHGRSIPGEYSSGAQNAYRIQAGIISRALRGLPRHKATPKVTTFNLGENFVNCYPSRKDDKGRVQYVYLFSSTDLIQGKISQYDGDGVESEL
jgi:hypothetical protein